MTQETINQAMSDPENYWFGIYGGPPYTHTEMAIRSGLLKLVVVIFIVWTIAAIKDAYGIDLVRPFKLLFRAVRRKLRKQIKRRKNRS